MTEKKKSRWQRIKKKLNDKYRLVIMNDSTFERKFSFRLSRLNAFTAVGTIVIVLVIATTFLIAYTPLREYIPGYGDVSVEKDIITLMSKADSLQKELLLREAYIQNIKDVINGKDFSARDINKPPDTTKADYKNLDIPHSKDDSLLRAEFENIDQYDLMSTGIKGGSASISNFFFFTPIQGIISNGFNPSKKHYGIDIVANKNEAVKSVLDGTVIIAAWTLQTGYVIAVQHQSDIISVYKHNSVLLKKEGDFIKAGDPIAIVGESGELQTGPHVHFELWYGGKPVNPREYILFK
jgi:murein DD-endopeptidase MepM/ murein hydrolase activator NlpD